MKKILVGTLVLLTAVSFANAVTLSVATGIDTGAPGAGKVIPINIAGGETGLQGITLYVSIPAFMGQTSGGITALEAKAGTVLGSSSNNYDAPTLIDLDSNGVNDAATSDYSMQFGAFATANGKAGFITIDTTGLAAGTYEVLLDIFGTASTTSGKLTSTSPVDVQTTLVNGSFTVTPEPATMLLLGLGGLFLRRRVA